MSRSRGGGRRRGDQNGFEMWGGYMGAKISKLEDQFSAHAKEEGETEGIFQGVSIFVNGYTDPSADELKRIMMMNGGTFHHYFSSRKTTHTIATNLPDSKVKALKGDEAICSPKWIVDSLQEGKLLDYRKYLLYSTQSKTQPRINFLPVSPKKTESPINPDNQESKTDQAAKSLDANDARFLGEFYNKSRLHHISTMGANFKRHINGLRENSDGTFPKRESLRTLSKETAFVPHKKKVIMHIDMDCFFVSVGLRKRPDLVGKPVAVAHAKGAKSVSPAVAANRKAEINFHMNHSLGNHARNENCSAEASDIVEFSSMSELASCSYEARAKGVKNGMFLGPALKLCPDLQTIPYDFEGYQEVAYALYDTVAQYTLDIQAVSCDEMLVDITEVLNTCRITPVDFSEHLRAEMFAQTKCHASVGLGSSLLLARMATKKAKPNGCFHLVDSEAEGFMKSVAVRDLPGVGWKTGRRLREMEIETCEQLQQMSLKELQLEFGAKIGESFFHFCRGVDDREVNLSQERKSVSAEVNYGIRFKSPEDCSNFFDQLSAEVQTRLEKLGVKGKSVTVKLMVRAADAPRETSKFLGHGICDSVSKSSNLSTHTDDLMVIKREVKMLLRQLNVNFEEMRGVGIQISKLEGNTYGTSSFGGAPRGSKSILSFMTKVEPRKMESKEMEPNDVDNHALSLSQLDQDVLAALPDDIRMEVEEKYGRPSNKRRADSPQPGPSRGGASPAKASSNTSKSLLEVTFSQVDPEYLAALPQEIADELRQELISAKQAKAVKVETAFDKMMHASKSPSSKNADNTPQKAKRGRPPKNSPRFIKSTSAKMRKVPPAVSRTLFETPQAEVHKPTVNVVVVRTAEIKEKANLEGKSDVDDVRLLLKQWLASAAMPTDDDVESVSKYFQDLVYEKSLEKLLFLVRLLWRKTSDMSKEWRAAYTSVVNNMQLVMIQNYGYQLFTNFDI